jgi:hypothetical protein
VTADVVFIIDGDRAFAFSWSRWSLKTWWEDGTFRVKLDTLEYVFLRADTRGSPLLRFAPILVPPGT